MSYFNFSRLITKYSSEFKAITLTNGYYDDVGDWIKAEDQETVVYGAIISHTESKIYRSEGTLTSQDKRLFMLEPLDAALYGSKVLYEGNFYSIEDSTQNAKFTGVYCYNLKYVSAFKESRVPNDITEIVEDLEQRLDGVLVEDTGTTEQTVSDNSQLKK